MRPGRWPSLVWRRSLPCARFPPGRSCSASSRRVSDDGTKRSRRSYSAGERGRNRVLVFPDPRTGLIQIEWREGGRRLTQSLGHRDRDRAKRQADAVACQCVRSSACCQATPAPARILPPTSRGAACSCSTPPLSRSPRRPGSRSRARARVSAPVRHDQRLVLLQPQHFQALRPLPGLNSAAPAPHPWPSYRHMDAIWTPHQIASPYTTIDLAVKHLSFMHLLQCPARDSNPEPTD